MPTESYTCAYCQHGAPYATRAASVKHEAWCPMNPETRTCATCTHFLIPSYHRRTFECNGTGSTRQAWKANCDKWEAKGGDARLPKARSSKQLCPACGSEFTFPPNRYGMSEMGRVLCYCPKCNLIDERKEG